MAEPAALFRLGDARPADRHLGRENVWPIRLCPAALLVPSARAITHLGRRIQLQHRNQPWARDTDAGIAEEIPARRQAVAYQRSMERARRRQRIRQAR